MNDSENVKKSVHYKYHITRPIFLLEVAALLTLTHSHTSEWFWCTYGTPRLYVHTDRNRGGHQREHDTQSCEVTCIVNCHAFSIKTDYLARYT